MMFSARSLELERSSAANRLSSSGCRPRREVPFIGRNRTWSPRRSKNSSGLALAMTNRPMSRYALWAPRCRSTRSRYSERVSPLTWPFILTVRLHWKVSPAAMYSRIRST